jgi:PIH1 CS-like domain
MPCCLLRLDCIVCLGLAECTPCRTHVRWFVAIVHAMSHVGSLLACSGAASAEPRRTCLQVHACPTIPRALVVRIALPQVNQASDADLTVTATHVRLHVPTLYLLDIQLPFCVDEARGSAKFDTATKALALLLPVHDNISRYCAPQQPVASVSASDDHDTLASHQVASADAGAAQAQDGHPEKAKLPDKATLPDKAPPPNGLPEEAQLPGVLRPDCAAADASGGADQTHACPASSLPRARATHQRSCDDSSAVQPCQGSGAGAAVSCTASGAAVECTLGKACSTGDSSAISGELGADVNLRALASGWDSANQRLDAEINDASCQESEACPGTNDHSEGQSSAAQPQNPEHAAASIEKPPDDTLLGSAGKSEEGTLQSEPLPQPTAPDVHLELALNLPMLDELD